MKENVYFSCAFHTALSPRVFCLFFFFRVEMPPIKRRYVLFQWQPVSRNKSMKLSEIDLLDAIRDKILKIHGDYGYSAIYFSLHLKKLDPITRCGILSTKRDSNRFLLTSLPFIQKIGNLDLSIKIIKITGTLRGSLRALQGLHGKLIYELKQKLKTCDSIKSAESKRKFEEDKLQISKGIENLGQCLLRQ